MVECAKESEAGKGRAATRVLPANRSVQCRGRQSARARDRAIAAFAGHPAPVHGKVLGRPRACLYHARPIIPMRRHSLAQPAAESQKQRDVRAKLAFLEFGWY